MKPGERVIISSFPMVLIENQRNHPLPFSWHHDHAPARAVDRDDGLVYVSGHRTLDAAQNYGLMQGWIEL